MANSGDMPIGIHACLHMYIYIYMWMHVFIYACMFLHIHTYFHTYCCTLCADTGSDHSSETPFHQQFSRSSLQYIPHWVMKQWKDQQNHSWINNRHMFNLSQIESTTIFSLNSCRSSPTLIMLPGNGDAVWQIRRRFQQVRSLHQALSALAYILGILQWWSWNAFGCHGPWVYIKTRIFIMKILSSIYSSAYLL